MTPLAWLVFAAFLAWVVWDGVRRTRAAQNLEDYFAGGRSIPWWAAGLSVMATQASAITVIGTTGQGHEGGLGFLQIYLGLPFAMILLCIFLVPLYRAQPILTAYEYLERRFDGATRSLGSLLFLFSRCLALGVVINAPAVVLSAMLDLPLLSTIIAVGLLTTVYTVLGGISAVVWTDVKQMTVILGGLLICFGVLAADVFGELGFTGALRAAGAAGKLDALEFVPEHADLVPRLVGSEAGKSFWDDKYNFWSGAIGGLFLMLSYFGCDQSQVQRILTNPTANDSRRALLLSAFAKVPMQFGVLAIGVLLFLFHGLHGEPLLYKPGDQARAEAVEGGAALAELQARYDVALEKRGAVLREIAASEGDPTANPELLARYQQAVREAAQVRGDAAKRFSEEYADNPEAGGKKGDTNYIFPEWLLAGHLHPLLLGLILAAVFAAAMSSVDSVLNSLSAATVVDFWQRYAQRDMSARQSLRLGRAFTLFWGVVATLTAIQLVSGGSIIEQVNKVGSYFYGSLLGVFVLGRFCPWARGFAGGIGILSGMASVVAVHLTLQVEYLWYNVIGLLGVLLGAWLYRLLGGAWPSVTGLLRAGLARVARLPATAP